MEEKYLEDTSNDFNWSEPERVSVNSVNSVKSGKTELELLKEELEFYKLVFRTHSNSVVFNLSIKKKNGKKVWVDNIRDTREYLLTLDKDDEVIEWLKPIKPSR